jgi:uncharacterized membrane protein SpoIIM required for sporulation
MSEFTLKSVQFRRERERGWAELEELVERVDRRGLESLSAAELARLPSLYRGAASSLAVAQAISLDKNLLGYLSALAGRAYLAVYRTKRPAAEAIAAFFRHRFPAAVRRYRPFVAAAAALLLLGVGVGYALTRADPERFYSFVPEQMADGRTPAASTDALRAALYQRPEGWAGVLGVFATFLFTHNAKLGIASFALGFAAGVPVVLLVFYNGLGLGAMAALYASRGLGAEFWAWVLPHGVTELGALVLCAAGGLALGHALVFPGRRSRLDHLKARGREVALLAIGAVAMFFAAGLIEGFFRQLVGDPTLRWAVAGVSLLLWSASFTAFGKGREEGAAGG